MTESEIVRTHQILQAECEGIQKKILELEAELNEHM